MTIASARPHKNKCCSEGRGRPLKLALEPNAPHDGEMMDVKVLCKSLEIEVPFEKTITPFIWIVRTVCV